MADTVADRRLHPATFVIKAVRALPKYLVGLPALVGVMSDSDLRTLLAVAAAGAVAAVLVSYLSWRAFRYGFGAHEIVIESGILHRQRRVIPFARVQDIDIERRLLARLFGAAKVRIETGGAAKDEGDLDSVSLAEAQRIRAILRSGASGEAPVEPAAEASATLYAMDIRRLLLAGLFNFSLFYLAFVVGGFEYLDALFGIDVFSLDWVDPARSLARGATWTLSLLAAALLLLVGVVAGVLRTVARDHGFRLDRVPRGLRRSRGLLTLSEVVIPTRRIQLAVIRAGAVARLFGWLRLEFQTLSADAPKAGNQVAAPLARIGEVTTILAEVGRGELPPDDAYRRVSRRHIVRQSLRWILILAAPLIAASVARPEAMLLLPLLPLAVGAAALQWRHQRYCLAEGALHVRHGFLTRRLWIVPFEKIQTLAVEQGPLQARLRLATLIVDTAGASPLRGPHIVNLPAADARDLAARLLAARKHARATPRP